MSDRAVPPKPEKPPSKGRDRERLAEALRANLARRKAQKRARATPERPDKDKG
jgi:hypothetical protein